MKFGIAYNVKSVVRVCTPELLKKALDSSHVARTCAEIEDALEAHRRGETTQEEFETVKGELKKRLPILTPHATFRNGRRKNAEAVPSGMSMYDLDHLPNPREHWEQKREELKAKNLLAYVVLAHITPSTEGLRLFFVIPKGMTLAEAQAWMAGQLGDSQYDACVKDYARSSYLVPRDYILHMDEDALFAPLSPPVIQSEVKNLDVAKESYPKSFKGIPYATIISEWFNRNGGEPQTGERNSKLHRLAAHLRYITDNNEAHLLHIMPSYGLPEEEMKSLIHSACSSKFCGMPQALNRLMAELEDGEKDADGPAAAGEQTEEKVPPPMPEELPPLIKLLVSRTPDIYKPAVAHAVFPSLAAHLWRVRFRYIDNVEHEATLMNVLMAGTGAGKDCISEPINRIMADIRLRDEENLRREREWKKEINSKGANKDKRQRPEGLVIQEIDADMTNPAFVMRTAEADGHFLYTKMNEIDQFDSLRGTGKGGQQFQIMCLAFDPGNRYGQTRVGSQSVTEKVTIRFNWNASTTIQKGMRYFRNVLTDGPVSRINFCTIPEREIGAEMPVYGLYGAEFDEQLRPYIERLTQATGCVECKEAYRLAKVLKDENAEFARLSQSRVYENLSFRANVIAYLKACVLYVAHGYQWDRTMEDFIRWSLRYDMWCKMEFFGNAIEEMDNTSRSSKPGPMNLLDLLPRIFTREEAAQMRQRQGVKGGSVKGMLNNWRTRGYIEPYGETRPPEEMHLQQYVKTSEYLDKHR